MSDEIKVKVHSWGNGRPLALVYFDPITGKKVNTSSGTRDEREAERAAAVLQAELNSGKYKAPAKITWQEFRERYTQEKLSSLAPSTLKAATVALDHLERIVNPDRVAKLTAAVLSRFQAELRKGDGTEDHPPIRETTLAHHLRHIKAALNWAAAVGLLNEAPKITMPKVAKGLSLMRGRPITGEEFDRMLKAVAKVREHDSQAWEDLLNGLWLSGLRLGEAVALSWDESDPFYVDLTGRRPVFRIYAEAQKARRDEILPMTPDFAEWLAKIPNAYRAGRVFKLPNLRNGRPFDHKEAGRVVGAIGEKAGIIVNKAEGKFATAHDLRRSFGTRWAKRVMPAVLQRLMRHSDIGTTMKYYVSANATDVADDLWAKWGTSEAKPAARCTTLGTTLPSQADAAGEATTPKSK